jgi:outer membrane biosynthesis protein TonB
MASAGRFFFAGMATSILLIGTGFVGGTMLAQRAVEPASPASIAAPTADQLPPARVILPSMTEAPAAPPPARPAEAVPSTPAQEQTQPQPAVAKGDQIQQQPIEKEKQADADKRAQRAEKRKAEAERERHKRYAERKAKRDAARAQQQQEQLQQQQQLQEATRQPIERPGIMAFDDEDEPKSDGFFGR